MQSIRSIIWIGPGSGLVENGIMDTASLDVVWVRDTRDALYLSLLNFDAAVLGQQDVSALKDALECFGTRPDVPPLLVLADSDEAEEIRALMTLEAGAVLTIDRDTDDSKMRKDASHILLENIFLLDESAQEDLAPGDPCPFLGQEAWVSAQGRFDPCCAPDAQRRTLGEFGNLSESSLSEIWQGEAYAGLVKTYRNRALCLGCNMRRPEVTS